MAAKRHVIVVGAGIIGASIAWHLAKAGAAVTVIAEETGGVATPNSFAWINASWGNPEFYFHFRRRSMAEWKRLAAELPGLPLTWCGGICWDLPRDQLEAYAKEHGGWGYEINRIKRLNHRREPYLSNAPDFALAVAEEGAVEPVAAARMMLADAEARGAKFIGAAVRSLIRSGDHIAGVVTSQGLIDADHVVLACGAGSVPIAASAGITLPIGAARPDRPLPPVRETAERPGDCDGTAYAPDDRRARASRAATSAAAIRAKSVRRPRPLSLQRSKPAFWKATH